ILNFQRTELILASGKKCIPTESCLVENVRSTDIKNYSTSSLVVFQKQRNFKILKIITHTDGVLTIPYAIGYWAVYTDDKEVSHKVIIIHALNNRGKGLQFLIDCPEEGFAGLEEEITGIIRSLSFL
ncbi:MAG: hypothetical protein H7259_07525, partial [Cytophagales bacterium]|nr:hypothetical protein [Cytophaga sp.]